MMKRMFGLGFGGLAARSMASGASNKAAITGSGCILIVLWLMYVEELPVKGALGKGAAGFAFWQ